MLIKDAWRFRSVQMQNVEKYLMWNECISLILLDSLLTIQGLHTEWFFRCSNNTVLTYFQPAYVYVASNYAGLRGRTRSTDYYLMDMVYVMVMVGITSRVLYTCLFQFPPLHWYLSVMSLSPQTTILSSHLKQVETAYVSDQQQTCKMENAATTESEFTHQ